MLTMLMDLENTALTIGIKIHHLQKILHSAHHSAHKIEYTNRAIQRLSFNTYIDESIYSNS